MKMIRVGLLPYVVVAHWRLVLALENILLHPIICRFNPLRINLFF